MNEEEEIAIPPGSSSDLNFTAEEALVVTHEDDRIDNNAGKEEEEEEITIEPGLSSKARIPLGSPIEFNNGVSSSTTLKTLENADYPKEEAEWKTVLKGETLGGSAISAEMVQGREYVLLPKEDLEAMIDARAEARAKQDREELEDVMKEERKDMEAMVLALFKEKEDSITAKNNTPPDEVPPDVEAEIELTPLVDMPVVQARTTPVQRPSAAKKELRQSVLEIFEEEMEAFKPPNEEDWHSPFGESVYTLLYMFECNSQSFLFGIFVYAIQITTIALTLADVAQNDIPPMVSLTVTIAQGVTVFMLQAYMSDLIEAVIKLQDGFYPEVLDIHPGADYGTWLFSCLAQLTAGLLLLATSFVLTMQSATVLDLMLNLTALLFMSEIDDIGFFMAKMGFITDKLQEEAESVAEFKVPRRQRKNRNKKILYFLALIGFFAGFIYIKQQQWSGSYLPTYIYVQFGDAYNPKIPYFSGIIVSGNEWKVGYRIYHDIETKEIALGYCVDKKSWAFYEGQDPCSYFAKSYVTDSYDVTSLQDSQWEVKDSIDRLHPFESFSLVSRDCDPETCQGICGKDRLCQCPQDHFGMDCEFENVCQKLRIDGRFEPFPPVKTNGDFFAISDEFHLLRNSATNMPVKVYNMPVYYSNATFPANIIFFGGRRWVLTTEWDLFDLAEARRQSPSTWFFKDRTVATLENGFHGYHQANYTPFFISDPVDFETPDFRPTPVGVNWWTVELHNDTSRIYLPDVPVNTLLSCREAPPSCIGQPDGYCGTGDCSTETGLCECVAHQPYDGDRCENVKPCFEHWWPCLGRGLCDQGTGFCRCNLPYFGQTCEGQYKCHEEGGACQNGGICDASTGDCECPEDPAISGAACEQRADCYVFGCANGGDCSWNGECVCRPPFYGTHCDLVNTTKAEHFCSSDDDCTNGTCNRDNGICDCDSPGSYGTRCEHTYDCSDYGEWGTVTCLNSGTCNESSAVCDCPKPFFGPDCSKVSLCANDNDCGGMSCDLETGLCPCSDIRADENRCRDGGLCSGHDDCYNGGTCNGELTCDCGTGYGGTFCDAIMAGMYSILWDDQFLQLEENITRCGFEDRTCDLCFEEDPPAYCDDP